MKRIVVVLIMLSLLCGCKRTSGSMDRALNIRKAILESNKCTFSLQITADYVDEYYVFLLECETDNSGDIKFCVTEPKSISGITGKLSAMGGKLIFDEKVLLFPMMVEDQLSPVSAPWLLIKALRSGYIKGATEWNNGLQLQIDDSFDGENLQFLITTDANNLPNGTEVFWQGRRILAMKVENFRIV